MDNAEEHWPSPDKLECRLSPLDWAALWGRFKSPRHFFEGPGRNEVRASADPWLKEAVAGAAGTQEGLLLDFYTGVAEQALKRSADILRAALAEREEVMSGLLKGVILRNIGAK